MRRLTITLAILLVAITSLVAPAQDSRPAKGDKAAADDLTSIDGVIAALYDVISGPAGPRDWDRFRGLFTEDGQLVAIGFRPDGTQVMRRMTPDDYIERSGPFLEENGFFEREVARQLEHFGPLAHAFSTYESRHEKDADPFARGINSIQLVNDGQRWYVLSIAWTGESDRNPLPAKYLP